MEIELWRVYHGDYVPMNFQIFISFSILAKFIVTIMADQISNKKIAENSTEVSLENYL